MEVIFLNRRYRFAKIYYNWILDCLAEDEKWEELAFFRMGVDLMVRQHELARIEWNQIEYPYVHNIEISKRINPLDDNEKKYYEPRQISWQTYDSLNKIWNDRCDGKIFTENLMHYIGSISVSAGVDFRGTYLRSLGIALMSGLINNMEDED